MEITKKVPSGKDCQTSQGNQSVQKIQKKDEVTAKYNKWKKPIEESLFGPVSKEKKIRPKQAVETEKESPERDRLLSELETNGGVWDLRFWHRDHDMVEILDYVNNVDVAPKWSRMDYIVKKLKRLGVDSETIALAIDRNKEVTFKHRLVPCGLGKTTCMYYNRVGNYRVCHCTLRCDQGLTDEQVVEEVNKRAVMQSASMEMAKTTPEEFIAIKDANAKLRAANEALMKENIDLKRKLGIGP